MKMQGCNRTGTTIIVSCGAEQIGNGPTWQPTTADVRIGRRNIDTAERRSLSPEWRREIPAIINATKAVLIIVQAISAPCRNQPDC